MTDETPQPPIHETVPDPLASAVTATGPAAGGRWWRRAGTDRWQSRRVPLVVGIAALLLGCLIGGALVAVVGDDHHGDRRGHGEYSGGRGNDHRRGDRDSSDRRERNRYDDTTPPTAPAPTAPAATAPASSAPTPSASS